MRYKYTKFNDLSIFGGNSHIAEAIVRAVFPITKMKFNNLFVMGVPETLKDESVIYEHG